MRWLTPLYYSKNKNSLLSIKHNCIFKKSGKHLIFRLLCTQLSLMEKWLIFYFSLLACKYTRKSSFKPEFQALLFLAYLLYISTSGFHIRCGGILRSFTPPYSEEFHRKLTSFHSWEPISINSVENRDNQQNKTKKKKKLISVLHVEVELHPDAISLFSALDSRCRDGSTSVNPPLHGDSSGGHGRPITKIYSKRWDECGDFSPSYFETMNPSLKTALTNPEAVQL